MTGLTEAQRKAISDRAIKEAEEQIKGIEIMTQFVQYADKHMFGNKTFMKGKDKKTGVETHKSLWDNTLFVKLYNQTAEALNITRTIDSAWNGQVSREEYDPTLRSL